MKKKALILGVGVLVLAVLMACAAPATTTQAPTTSASVVTTKAPPTSAPAVTTTAAPAKPQGELVGAIFNFATENWLPWEDPSTSTIRNIFNEYLIYWDEINRKTIPGLAESWEVTPDGMTTTFHLRKGVQFHDGWGEFTSADVKFTWDTMKPLPRGKTSIFGRVESVEAPRPYTVIIHTKDPYHAIATEFCNGNSSVNQGFVCKKYYETVGKDVAAQKPIATGPYKMVETKTASYVKFEALDSHWRVVPKFKFLTVRLIPEDSTVVAALKTGEIDLANVPTGHKEDLDKSGVAAEISIVGGGRSTFAALGGMCNPGDSRYDPAYHNKDPWVDSRVRKAMTLAIDHEALCKGLFKGLAQPATVPLVTPDAAAGKYPPYPYDPAAAKQLLKDAGYPDGFGFKVISYRYSGVPESVDLMQAAASYWQQIGLRPEIEAYDYNTYYAAKMSQLKTAGEVYFLGASSDADTMVGGERTLLSGFIGKTVMFMDEATQAIYENNPHSTFEDRMKLAEKLNQYYYDNIGPIPLIKNGLCFAWNKDKVSPWPHAPNAVMFYFEYVRHAQPLNTFRLFNPWPDR